MSWDETREDSKAKHQLREKTNKKWVLIKRNKKKKKKRKKFGK